MPLPDFIFQFLGFFFFFLLSLLVPAGHGALEREAPGMCSLSRYQCLPSLGRQEIPQIHDFFFPLSFLHSCVSEWTRVWLFFTLK